MTASAAVLPVPVTATPELYPVWLLEKPQHLAILFYLLTEEDDDTLLVESTQAGDERLQRVLDVDEDDLFFLLNDLENWGYLFYDREEDAYSLSRWVSDDRSPLIVVISVLLTRLLRRDTESGEMVFPSTPEFLILLYASWTFQAPSPGDVCLQGLTGLGEAQLKILLEGMEKQEVLYTPIPGFPRWDVQTRLLALLDGLVIPVKVSSS